MKVFVLIGDLESNGVGRVEAVYLERSAAEAARDEMNLNPFAMRSVVREFEVRCPVDPIALIRRLLAARPWSGDDGHRVVCLHCGGEIDEALQGHLDDCPYVVAMASLYRLEAKPG